MRRFPILLLAAALLGSGCGELERGPKLVDCSNAGTAGPSSVESDDVVASCGPRDGERAAFVVHDRGADPDLAEPWDVWVAEDGEHGQRALRVDGDLGSTKDGLSSWHEARFAGITADGDKVVVGDLHVTEYSDGTDEPRTRQRARWWAIDLHSGDRRELASDSYDADDVYFSE